MDDPSLDAERHAEALRGLSRINLVSGSAGIIWPELLSAAARTEAKHTPLRVLDVATGGGDVAVRLWKKARRAGVPIEIAGCDASEQAIAFARRRAAAADANVHFFCYDLLGCDELTDEYDVVCCSLFLHHLSNSDACTVLRRLAYLARDSLLVNDLLRRADGMLLASVAPRLLTRSPVVHCDAKRSVRNAFTEDEVLALAERAGLHHVRLKRHWPCRYLLTWRRL